MTFQHMMIDLETMGSRPGCAIATIGAVMFDPVFGDTGDRFYCRIDLGSCVQAGLRLEPDTVVWWLKQSDAARAELTRDDGLQLRYGLQAFGEFWRAHDARFIWSHGANFDGPIIAAAFEAVNMAIPWKYWDARDTRTIYDLAGVKPVRSIGVAHHAKDDAVNQADAVIAAYAKLGLAKGRAEVAHG